MKQPLDHPWRNGFPAREPDGAARIEGGGTFEVLRLAGNLTVGGEPSPKNVCPTPRFDNDGNCTLPPRQHAYTVSEVKLHSPEYRAKMAAMSKEDWHGPMCLCGSRNQAKIGVLLWRCVPCGRVNEYRCTEAGFLPFTREVARAMDEERATR